VLSDEAKRRQYDQSGSFTSSGGDGNADFDFDEFYRNFDEQMKAAHKAHNDAHRQAHRQAQQANNHHFDIFDDLFDDDDFDFFKVSDGHFYKLDGESDDADQTLKPKPNVERCMCMDLLKS
jgi:hypothetical protein